MGLAEFVKPLTKRSYNKGGEVKRGNQERTFPEYLSEKIFTIQTTSGQVFDQHSHDRRGKLLLATLEIFGRH